MLINNYSKYLFFSVTLHRVLRQIGKCTLRITKIEIEWKQPVYTEVAPAR